MKERASLPSIAREIEKQPAELTEFLVSSRVRRARNGSLLVGAGDSYAASLSVSSISSLRLLALDPRVLAQAPEAARGRNVYITSVSGRTAANLEAARRVRGLAKKTVAITADSASPLAREADELILMPFRIGGKAPGILSFSLSLLILSLLESPGGPWDFQAALTASRSTAGEVSLSGPTTTYFLGNHAAYGVATYGAAKVREFLGWRSVAVLLEEFGHMDLLSLSGRESVNIFADFDGAGAGEDLAGLLSRRGYRSRLVRGWGKSDVERLFHLTFTVQLAALWAAESVGLSRPYFLGAKKQLEISDAAIY